MKAHLVALNEEQLESGDEGGTCGRWEELQKSDPKWVSDWLARKVLNGLTRFGGWSEMITDLPAEEQQRLLTRFSNELLEPNEKQRVLSLLATTADEGTRRAGL